MSPNRNMQILDPMSPSYLCFRLDAYDRNGTKKKNEHADDAVRLFRQNRRRLRGDVSFKVRCTLFTVFPFFFLSPLTTKREKQTAPPRSDRQIVRRISRIYRLAISIIATIASMATFIRRARFPIRRRYSESALFFLHFFASRWSMKATFLSAIVLAELSSSRRSALLRVCRLAAIIRANN